MNQVNRRSFLAGIALSIIAPFPSLVNADDDLIEGGRLSKQDIDDFVELTLERFKANRFVDIQCDLPAYEVFSK